MRILYNAVIFFYGAMARLTALFNHKARLWVNGRKDWYGELKNKIVEGDSYIWIHCASLGEFEQGRPVIESIRREKPDSKIVLTFFSPSGFEVRKNYKMVDIITYLPEDTKSNAVRFLDLVNPVQVIFVKYEFWDNYISGVKNRGIPLFLVSGIFRKEQQFFKWYGGFFRNILRKFTKIFVQDDTSAELLKSIGIENVTVAGDTRFDRVAEIAGQARSIPQLDLFKGAGRVFLAGSSWRQDEEIIARYINDHPDVMKWVFAPHEPDAGNIERIEKLLEVKSVRFSKIDENNADATVLIIDNIGMLSSAYRYAFIAAVGGGFGRGIHNILEPACWGIPILFGPNFSKFREALEMLDINAAKTFSDYDSFKSIVDNLISDENLYRNAASAAGSYVDKNRGATAIIMKEIV